MCYGSVTGYKETCAHTFNSASDTPPVVGVSMRDRIAAKRSLLRKYHARRRAIHSEVSREKERERETSRSAEVTPPHNGFEICNFRTYESMTKSVSLRYRARAEVVADNFRYFSRRMSERLRTFS